MDTRLIDVHDDTVCSRAHDIIVASRGYERPWLEAPSQAEMVVDWRHDDEAERKQMWGAYDGDVLLGVALVRLPMTDNTSIVWLDVQVDPAHRRRGAGSALVERVVARAREEGRRTVVTDLLVPPDSDGHPYRAFAERYDFQLSNTEIIRHLQLPVDDELLTRHADAARPRWEGDYRIESYVGGVPEHLQESLCAVMNQLAVDAPTGDIEFEEESFTPARYQEHLELFREQGRVRLTTVAVHEATGDVVAYTDLILPSGAPTVVWQWGTLVHRDHRGRRLGMAVKIENLRRLQAEHPERGRIQTANDDTNSWMVSINEDLGFRIVELCPAYHRSVN